MPDTTSAEDLEVLISEQIDKASNEYEDAIEKLRKQSDDRHR